MKKRFLSLLLSTMLLSSLFPLSAMAESSDITYSSYVSFANGNDEVKLTGDATTTDSGIILTTSEGSKAGAAFFKNKIKQSDGFSTFFKFTLDGQINGGADGIVFIIAKDTNQLGEVGGGIGYTGIANSVGIEFDTYQNGDDVSDSHIGIDLNGSLTSDTNISGGALDLGAGYLHGVGGTQYYTWVDYHSGTLEVRISKTSTRPTDAMLSKTIDLSDYCGDEYYVGFTAATGGSWEEHKITQWYFNNKYSSSGLTPDTNYGSDSTAPTTPTISLSGTTLTCSGSTDTGSGVDHYEYKIGASGTWTTVDSTNKAEISNYYTDASFSVNARAIDKVGNISALGSLTCNKPEVTNQSSNTITISAITGCQYAITASDATSVTTWSEAVTSDGAMTFQSLSAGTPYKLWVRSDSSTSSGISRGVYTAEEAPVIEEGYSIDYDTEKISISNGYEVSTESAFGHLVANTSTIEVGSTYYVRKAVNTTTTPNTPASEAATFTIVRPAAPSGTNVTNETISNKNDGTITGVTTEMQYKKSTESSWTDSTTNGAITGLVDGIYKVRYKAVTTGSNKAFASSEATLTISEGATITVTFQANGGSTSATITGKAYGESISAPMAPTKTGYYFAGWYKDIACTQPWSFGIDTVIQDTALYAKWSAVPTYTVSGAVADEDNFSVSGAAVKVMQGTIQYGDTILSDANGDFAVEKVPSGIYNLIIIKASQQVTVLVTVANGDVAIGKATLPSGNANSILEVSGSDTPNIVVGNLNTEATMQLASAGGMVHTVEIKLTVTKEASDNTTGSAVSTAATAAGKQIGMILDIDLTKTEDSVVVSSFNETSNLIEIYIPLPSGLQGKNSYIIYRYHNASVDAITTEANANGEYLDINTEKTALTLYAKKFSTYLIAFTASTSSSHHSSSGSTISPTGITTSSAITGTGIVTTGNYSDVKVSDWYNDAIAFVTEKGFMNGIAENFFGPSMETTRGMIVTTLYRMEGQPTANFSNFEDVRDDQYFAKAVAWGEANGIVKGYSATVFGPEDYITREQMAAIIHRYIRYIGNSSSSANDLASFSDAQKVSYWAVSDVQWAVGENILNGTSEGLLSPTNPCTRGQAAMILMRLEQNIMVEQ